MKLIASTNLYSIRYDPRALVPPVAKRYLGAPFHPIRPKVAHMYDTRDQNTLWWRVAIYPLQQYRRVVRSWSARRTRLAFEQALEARGFDREGRRVMDNARDTGKKKTSGNLTGSFEILVREATIKEQYPTIQKEMSLALDALLRAKRQQNRASGDPNKRKKRERVPNTT